jgi:DNA-binding XRE family transcriptional regulator
MKQLEYDKELMKLVTELRERTGFKHINLSNCLGIDRTTYGRMEHGDLGFTPGQFRIMAQSLKTNHFQLMALVETKFEDKFFNTTFSSLLIKALKMIQGDEEEISFSASELQFVIKVLQNKYLEVWSEKPNLRYQ